MKKWWRGEREINEAVLFGSLLIGSMVGIVVVLTLMGAK